MNVLETHVLELIGENTSSPDVFVDTDEGLEPIRESLNDAIEEISHVTGSYKRTYQVFLVEGQGFYRMKFSRGDLAWITDAWLVNEKRRLEQSDLITLTANNPRWMVNSGPPDYYLHIGTNILGLAPAPASEGVLELSMVMIPERMSTSTDRILLRDAFKWAAVHFAVGEFFASRGDAKEASSWHEKYLMDIGQIKLYPRYQERNYAHKTK